MVGFDSRGPHKEIFFHELSTNVVSYTIYKIKPII